MEVGAVKQAFNNELIILKKKLNQAKIQVIHKLTRKAKTLMEKKVPEAMKEKFKRKAEHAVNEVLIIKKIKPRDIGKFILTHKGKLQDHLNKPQVDQDKACARLLLHKALQDKYKFIKSRFSGVPINDLFMSRAERQKMKKEAREKQKEKLNKKKGKVVNAEGDWDVEDVVPNRKVIEDSEVMEDSGDDVKDSEDPQDDSEGSNVEGEEEDNGSEEISQGEDNNTGSERVSEFEESVEDVPVVKKKVKPVIKNKKSLKDRESENSSEDDDDDEIKPSSKRNFVKINPIQEKQKFELKIGKPKLQNGSTIKDDKKIKKTAENKQKDSNKKKNLNEKLLNRKFRKNTTETREKEVKVVDPFFITSTGENYMSLAEPRQPDEVKEVHKQGNRKLRRAVMFGHVPKIKPRQEFRQDSERFDRNNKHSNFNRNSGKFDRQNYGDKNDRSKNNSFGKDSFKNNDRTFNKKDNFSTEGVDKTRNFKDKNSEDSAKPEKLHPSWEAKKRQSGILPFQGKKIVFNDS